MFVTLLHVLLVVGDCLAFKGHAPQILRLDFGENCSCAATIYLVATTKIAISTASESFCRLHTIAHVVTLRSECDDLLILCCVRLEFLVRVHILGHIFNLLADFVGISKVIHDPPMLQLINQGFKLF